METMTTTTTNEALATLDNKGQAYVAASAARRAADYAADYAAENVGDHNVVAWAKAAMSRLAGDTFDAAAYESALQGALESAAFAASELRNGPAAAAFAVAFALRAVDAATAGRDCLANARAALENAARAFSSPRMAKAERAAQRDYILGVARHGAIF